VNNDKTKMPILVYSGHSHHRVTGSTAFFLDLLAQKYQLSVIWDESWTPAGAPLLAEQINALNPDVVLFFQLLPTRKELRKIRCNQLFLVPMHDGVVGNPGMRWKKIRDSGLQVINFCRATHAFFTQLGYRSMCVQYWPPPQVSSVEISKSARILFWARKRDIGWPLLKTLLGAQRPERIVLRIVADPGEFLEMPSADEISDYKIEVVTEWLDKSRYMELLRSCNVFMAPRLYEGIGQSFLEAMSFGMAVIAPDSPTMNEYIQHGHNGYLYSYAAPAPIDLSRLDAVRAQVLKDVSNGHFIWQSQESDVLEYIEQSKATKRRVSLSWRLRRLLGH
jgi:glycosyltransferase involved in cell wall biosynthesis